ncbi:hypothetical protein JOF28_001730 [Leucobacter exalbidus]|uniref:Uncharacterized protein n=1 Tax=Leucobacter exalbidus TaxID=662960 RepID=A0A940PNN3_9MICO|nr:hypothetical protein [Leucobacter exalbidus]MBP1326498.1 hypothetical protein [Leucobacter exalbidus]
MSRIDHRAGGALPVSVRLRELAGRRGPARVVASIALVAAGSVALVGCAASAPAPDNSGSIEVIEQFFDHLEAGEATAAAALTDVDFDAALIDDDLYAASAAIPSDARIVSTVGDGWTGVTAQVEYVLDDQAHPETLELRARTQDGVPKITGLGSHLSVHISLLPYAGTLTINDAFTFTPSEVESGSITLLPARYDFTYADPTGLLEMTDAEDSAFTVQTPTDDLHAIRPTFRPDVEPAVAAEIQRLQGACEDEGLTGPSCPSELVEALRDVADPAAISVSWFRQTGPDLVLTGQEYELAATYLARLEEPRVTVTVSYAGRVTRDEAGTVVLER